MDTTFEVMHPFYIERASHSNKFSMHMFHYHLEYEIYFMEEGERNLIVDNKLINIKKYDVGLISSNTIHHTSGDGCTRTLIYVSTNYLKRFFTDKTTKKLLSCFSKNKVSLSPEVFAQCKKMLTSMQKETADNPKDNNSFIIDGKHLKSINQYYNKQMSHYQSKKQNQKILNQSQAF